MPEERSTDRLVTHTREAAYRPFDRYGEIQPKLHWLPMTYDNDTGHGCFMIRFDPGGRSWAHEHTGIEEFYVVEGELIDSDGTVFRAGDFVRFGPGTRHWSHSPDGALLVVFMRGHNRLLDTS